MFTPVRCDEYLVWVQFLTHSHPLVILWIHEAETVQVTEIGSHVFAKVTSVWWAMLVKVFEVWPEEISRISTSEACCQRIILEEVDVQAEFVPGI
jgi:hypothetical protein